MVRLSDTSPEAERVLREALSRLPFSRRWQQMGDLWRTARALHAAGVRSRHAQATPDDIHRDWLRTCLGQVPAAASGKQTTMINQEILPVVLEVLAVLDRLGIAYALGGSWASSLLGKMRFTADADLTVEPFPTRVTEFCSSFGEDYYVSPEAVRDAVRRRSSVNVIHLTSGFKIDLFVRKERPFEISAMNRRQVRDLPGETGRTVVCVTPEDIVLFKLEWYRLGGESSDRQWGDVLGVLQVQAGRLDEGYLDHWAAELGVADLLERARQESTPA